MPLYAISCECGSDEGFDTLADRDEQGGLVRCLNCHALNTTRIVPVQSLDVWSKPKYVAQVDRSFASQKELDSYCQERGVEYVSRDSATWRKFHDRSKAAADGEAQEAGFRDARHRKEFVVKNQRDIVASNRQRKIDEYHEQYGSEGKKTVEEAFGELPS